MINLESLLRLAFGAWKSHSDKKSTEFQHTVSTAIRLRSYETVSKYPKKRSRNGVRNVSTGLLA